MARDLPLRCACGKLRGLARDVSPELGNHVVCYCGDCQAFARFLDRPGTTDDAGGTAIFQLPPSHVTLTEGLDQLRCMRLSARGLHRWYAGCCRTAIANTVGAGTPFVGLIHTCIEHERGARDQLLGKPFLIHARQARGAAPAGAHPKVPLALIARIVPKLAKWLLTGKGSPSPFYGSKGAPRVEPQILTASERDDLRGEARPGS